MFSRWHEAYCEEAVAYIDRNKLPHQQLMRQLAAIVAGSIESLRCSALIPFIWRAPLMVFEGPAEWLIYMKLESFNKFEYIALAIIRDFAEIGELESAHTLLINTRISEMLTRLADALLEEGI